MAAEESIRVWDRAASAEVDEPVYGGGWIRFLYGAPARRRIADLLARRWFSRVLGRYYRTARSRRAIAPFVERYGVDPSEFVAQDAGYGSFEAFFVRAFRPGARPFPSEPTRFGAFAEARYRAWRALDETVGLELKGGEAAADALFGVREAGETGPRVPLPTLDERTGFADRFRGGPVLAARLCPIDYHRFHYPDDGRTLAAWRVPGSLHSVNPWALATRRDVFATNERRVAILHTERFGALAYVEVGAMNVGRIVQTHPEREPFARGAEKGMFRFGASAIVVVAEPGAIAVDDDLVERTAAGGESLVRLGEGIARVSRAG